MLARGPFDNLSARDRATVRRMAQPGEAERAGVAERSDVAPAPGLRLPVWAWLALWLALWVGASAALHASLHGGWNGWHLALATFLSINVLVCVWEISLWRRIDEIERWHHEPRVAGGRPRGSVFLARLALRDLGTLTWARIWSEYARYDPAYADRRSFGFAIDVGNGFSTLLPSLFFLVGMSVPLVSAPVLGIVGLLVFYQKLYGTLLYFFTFLFQRRYRGHRLVPLLLAVGGSNGIWLLFPALGLYVCVRLILENRFDLLWG